MTSAFQDLIKNTTLTKKESQIADYVLNNFREVCFMTSTELAEKLQISHSSVIRFTKDLAIPAIRNSSAQSGHSTTTILTIILMRQRYLPLS